MLYVLLKIRLAKFGKDMFTLNSYFDNENETIKESGRELKYTSFSDFFRRSCLGGSQVLYWTYFNELKTSCETLSDSIINLILGNHSFTIGGSIPAEEIGSSVVELEEILLKENIAHTAENECIKNADTGCDVSVPDNRVTIKVVMV